MEHRLRDIVRAEKRILDVGAWKYQSKMPKTAFPLSKATLQIRANFHWRIVRFECLSATFRLLIAYRSDLEVYTTYLGREDNGDMTVIARYEFHASHGGWHYHTNCGSEPLMSGRTGNLDHRLPMARSHHRRMEFGTMDDARAYYVALKAFGLQRKADFELQIQ